MSSADTRLLVAYHLLDGRPIRDVAKAAGLAAPTVKTHVGRMLADYGVETRAGIINAMLVVGEREPLPRLPAAYRDIARRLIAGESYATIARKRRRKITTVSVQATRLLRRLGVHSSCELAARYEAR
jgi:DNA-binding NarL/FixJ family response regulator